MRIGLGIGIGISLMATAATTRPEAPTTRRSSGLLGIWALDAARSEDARAKMSLAGSWRRAGGVGRAGAVGPRPGGGWDAPVPGGPYREPDPETAARDELHLRRVPFVGANRLDVTGTDAWLMVSGPPGVVRGLRPDGEERQVDNGARVKARWHGPRLVVQTRLDRGEVKETWRASSRDGRLTIEFEIERDWGPSVKVKRVFDRVEPAEAVDAPPP